MSSTPAETKRDLDDAVFDGQAGTLLPRSASSTALSASILVKSGAGYLYGVTVLNTNAGAQYIQLHDVQDGVPADGAVPVWVITVPGATSVGIDWIPARYCSIGIVLCNSSTAATKTIGSADCFFDVQYV